MGGISINSCRTVRCPWFSTVGAFAGAVLERRGGGCLVWCLAHCWVLRQQGREGLFFPGLFVSGFLAAPVTRRALLWWGLVCGVCGTGLLFENYIVDASILYKKQFPRY